MTTFRGLLILSGLVILGMLWGSFAWWYDDVRHTASNEIKFYLWSNLVAITFLIVVRIWDAYEQHKDEVHL